MNAGRILIMPKGKWDAEKEYEMLDFVKHNGTAWLGKKPSVGIEPSETNAEYWMDVFDITAEAVGALSKNGGELEGNLDIVRNNAIASLKLSDVNSPTHASVQYNPTSKSALLRNFTADADNTYVQLLGNDTELKYILNLWAGAGTPKRYSIFGEHNIDLVKNALFATKTYSGTTDANGFLKPKELTVDTTSIMSCKIVNGSGFCTPFNDTDAHWSFKFENWDRTPVANKLATVKIIYIND